MLAYVDGRYVPLDQPAIGVEDRGYQFADGVYEVCALERGRVIDEAAHFVRLQRSCRELRLRLPVSVRGLGIIVREVLRRNRLEEGKIYIQLTRGCAPRDHGARAPRAVLVVTLRPTDGRARAQSLRKGIAVITLPDNRWARCDIKSIALLPNVLARQDALRQRAEEAWFVGAEGLILEGAASTAWIVDAKGIVRTHPLSAKLLPGITRARLLAHLRAERIAVEERGFTPKEALAAREAFQTTSTASVIPVVRLNGQAIRDGKVGALSRALQNFDRQSNQGNLQASNF